MAVSPSIGIHSLNKGSTKTRQCQTINGITTCKDGSDAIRRCQGFTIGGNCAGQNDAVDKVVRKTPDFNRNNLQMGNFVAENQRFGLNGINPPRLETNTQRKQLNVKPLTALLHAKMAVTQSDGARDSLLVEIARDKMMP